MFLKSWFIKKKFLIFITSLVIILSTLPYIYGWLHTPEGYYYTGLHALSPVDYHVYASYLEQVKQGHLFFKDLYTHEEQPFRTLNIFWLFLGLLSKFFNLSNLLTYHLARILLILIFVLVAYKFIKYFFEDEFWQKTALVFLLFSSGIGGFISPVLERLVSRTTDFYLYNPMDVWATEANTFLTLYHTPHFIASLTLIIAIFYLVLRAVDKEKIKFSVLAGFLALVLFQFHPFYIVTVISVISFYFLIIFLLSRQRLLFLLKNYLIFLTLSLPSIIYYCWLLINNWLTQQIALQNINLTPVWWAVLLSYGFLVILLVSGLIYLFREQKFSNKNIFLITWLFVNSVIIYLPLNFQRRLTEGYHIVIVILGIYGLILLSIILEKRLSLAKDVIFKKNKVLFLIVFIILFCFSNFFNLVRDFYLYRDEHPYFYLKNTEKKAIDWLKINLKDDNVVMADLVISNLIPGLTGKTSYAGHGVETAYYYQQKAVLVYWFYNIKTVDFKRKEFLSNQKISHIYYGPREKELGGFEPDGANYLEKVYENEEVEIFCVKISN